MTDATPNPRRIEWAAPEGWTIWADEDGVHLRTRQGDAMDAGDVDRLFRLWSEIREAVNQIGTIPAPRPPSREEIRAAGYPWREQHEKRRVIRAVESAFDDDTIAPF